MDTSSVASTILELKTRLKELELKFLGSTSVSSAVSKTDPFTPISTVGRRIESFRTSGSEKKDPSTTQAKLPAVNLPNFDGTDLEGFLKAWQRWLRLSGVEDSSDKLKTDWLIEACTPKVRKLVEKLVDDSPGDLLQVLRQLETLFPKLENDITLRSFLEKVPSLPAKPDPAAVAQLFVEMEEILSRMSSDSMSD